MSELRKIMVCQNTTCQDKGSKTVLHRLNTRYVEQYGDMYPDLRIEAGDCNGDCEWGPIVKVNDSMVLRNVDKELVEQLLQHPEQILGDVMHVLEKDRETFDRIIGGELF